MKAIQKMLTGLAFCAGAMQAGSVAQAVPVITPVGGYSITWDGNDGLFSSDTSATVPNNIARSSGGAIAFGTGALVAPHTIANVNNGLYGNVNSWISAPSATPSIGVNFNTGVVNVTSIAFGRDNGLNTVSGDSAGGVAGQFQDRALGTYNIQRTLLTTPASATFTGNAATGWETIGTITYTGNDDTVVGGAFTSYYRHEYQVSLGGNAVPATAIRLANSSDQIAIDEVEVYGSKTFTLLATGSHNVGNVVPNNLALASNGGVAFAKDLLGNGSFAPTHTIPNINDGLYGNQDSWIGNSDNSFIGVKLPSLSLVDSVAWGRDNGGEANAFTDRTLGVFTLQYTTVANPNELTLDSDWITIGTLDYTNLVFGNKSARHLWGIDPVLATGLRLIVPGNGIGSDNAIDEFEVFGVSVIPEPATMSLLALGALVMGRRRRRNDGCQN